MPASVTILNHKLCLSAEALRVCMGVSEASAMNTVKRGLHRYQAGESPHYASFPDTSDARRRWVVYESLPEITRQRVDHYYGPLDRLYVGQELPAAAKLAILPTDIADLQALGCPMRLAEAYATSAGWCRAIEKWDWKPLFNLKVDAYQVVLDLIVPLQLQGLRCTNSRVLIRKLAEWRIKGLASLVSKHIGNNHATVDSETRAWREEFLAFQYGQPIKPTIAQVARLYNEQAANRQLKPLCEERCRQILQRPRVKLLWLENRHGRQAARSLTESHVRTRRASRPDAMWGIDGTTVQLYSADGRFLKKEWYMVLVTDAHSRAIIGVALDRTEVAQVVLSAIYSAVKFGGFAPDFVQYDGGAANRGREVQEALGRIESHGIQGQPYNGKGRHTESMIGEFEQRVLRHLDNFVGGNITGRSLQSRANPDHLAWQLKEGKLPSPEAVQQQLRKAVAVYNNTAGPDGRTPREKYLGSIEGRRQLAEQVEADLFWTLRTGKDGHGYRYAERGIVMELRGQRYYFEVESAPGIQDRVWYEDNLDRRFYLKYNPLELDPTCVHLYDIASGEVWQARANRKHEFAQAPGEMQPGERSILNTRLADRSATLDEARAKREEMAERMRADHVPEASFELLHKDALNAAYANAELEQIEAHINGKAFAKTEARSARPPSKPQPTDLSHTPLRVDYDLIRRINEAEENDTEIDPNTL